MTTPDHEPSERLRDEILAEARRERDAILERARHEADSLLTQTAQEADEVHRKRLEEARTEAARRREFLLATVPVEAGRLRSARVEQLLLSVQDEVRQRLRRREGLDYREVVVGLTAEAIGQMAGDAFVVRLPGVDRMALGEALAAAIQRRAGRSPLSITLSEDSTLQEGGLIVGDREGRQIWDNGLLSRLNRFWPQLRQQIASQTSILTHTGSTGGTS